MGVLLCVTWHVLPLHCDASLNHQEPACVHVKGHKLWCHKLVSALRLLSMYMLLEYILKHVALYVLLISLSCDVRTGHVWPSTRKYTANYRSRAAGELNWSFAFELELSLWKRPHLSCTTPLFWCSRSCLLSGEWRRAKEVIASLEQAPSESSHCRSYWLTHGSLCGCRRCQGSPSPFTASLPHSLFQAAERNPAH